MAPARSFAALVGVLAACLSGGCERRMGPATADEDASPPRGPIVFDGLAMANVPGRPGAVILRNVGDDELELSGLRIAAVDDTDRVLLATAIEIAGDGMLDPGEQRWFEVPGPRAVLLGPEHHVLLRATSLEPLPSR